MINHNSISHEDKIKTSRKPSNLTIRKKKRESECQEFQCNLSSEILHLYALKNVTLVWLFAPTEHISLRCKRMKANIEYQTRHSRHSPPGDLSFHSNSSETCLSVTATCANPLVIFPQ